MNQQKDGAAPELDKVNISDLLKRSEDEVFDRTLGGQDKIGRAIAGFGTKRGGILLVGQADFKEGGKLVGVDDDVFRC